MKEINFALNLKNLRKAFGMTQGELAKKLSVDQRTVSAWENGICEPSFTMLKTLCEIFNEDYNGLLS